MPQRPRSRTFEDVETFQKAHSFVLDVYRATASFPTEERFGLTSQVRRAAIAIPANFAEGFKKRTIRDKARFYNVAQGSVEECRYYLLLSRDLGYGDFIPLRRKLEEVSRLLERYLQATLASEG